jgi:hypothetical protein
MNVLSIICIYSENLMEKRMFELQRTLDAM